LQVVQNILSIENILIGEILIGKGCDLAAGVVVGVGHDGHVTHFLFNCFTDNKYYIL
jgi:hypothetical protein